MKLWNISSFEQISTTSLTNGSETTFFLNRLKKDFNIILFLFHPKKYKRKLGTLVKTKEEINSEVRLVKI